MIVSDARAAAMEINYLVKLGRMLRITKVRTYQNLTFIRTIKLWPSLIHQQKLNIYNIIKHQ